MNTRVLSLTFGLSLTGLLAFSAPALANTPNMAHYGAGYVPAPIFAPEEPPLYTEQGFYGAAYATYPQLPAIPLPADNPTHTRNIGNYGAGFFGSPTFSPFYPANIRYGNYGSGFFPSPPNWRGYGLRLFW